ncbi:MAG: transposase [Acidobacteriota bacterium]
MIDSKPIAACKPIRHSRARNLREDGAYFGKGSCGWFFGFKLHLLRNIDGGIEGAILTPANTDDRDPALGLLLLVDGGIVLADLGYRGKEIAAMLAEEADMLIITRADAPGNRELISTLRQRIETTFSQLWNRFIDRVLSRSWLGLWNTIKLKMLHYNLCHTGILSA